ncbi:hypothetical protein LTR78_010315 [Recurvomyces mirabilis]|uniref:Azaphilone pigments biosynthesis cluster protein L N-terminal domain-containing protein n=1 Tax=Recurvomyces mirabilis TaxID=574656 RepID=A0AAE0TQN6_9PEZI|nr:hypothetical protein LTR78_010315 [Recurvomyces mirabilis]KAK5149871.1 hypothetical protein LTS14_010586 [Recurvomyces mirabilis]
MADPLSVAASVLAISTAAIQSAKSLFETVKRYRDRDKTLRRLQDELEDLTKVLESLTKATNTEQSVLSLLQGPVERCSLVCQEFESSMEVFGKKSKTGFRDWTRMEFMRGDINEFIETIAGYKSTISVGLGTITMHTSKISHDVLVEYSEMIHDTTYNLELHLQRIEEKMTKLTTEHKLALGGAVDLKDEKDVTRQCLRICEAARSYLDTVSTDASTLLQEASQNGTEDELYDAQRRTREMLDETRDNFTRTSNHLARRLESLSLDQASTSDCERQKLQTDIEISKQCLEVCNMANDISRQRVYKVGEAVADGDSDQVLVTTMADLFDIGKAVSRENSAQLLGFMSSDDLRHIVHKRYASRFGTVASQSIFEVGSTGAHSFVKVPKTEPLAHAMKFEQDAELVTRQHKPSSNEIRKRTASRDDKESKHI